MKFHSEVSALQKSPLFRGIDPARLRVMAFLGEIRTFREGEYVFRQGDQNLAAYLILSGQAEVLVDVKDEEVPITKLGESEIVGEIAMLCETPRTASVRAVGDLSTLSFDRDPMMELMNEFPEVAMEMARSLAQRLERTTHALVRCRMGEPD